MMSLVWWAKKELAKLKSQTPNRLPQPPPLNYTASSQVTEEVVDADIRCINCQHRLAALVSTININDLESIVVDVIDKKVTLTRKPINLSSQHRS